MKKKKVKNKDRFLESILKKSRVFLKDNVMLLTILILSFFLRFVNYSNRWGIAYDQARDAIVVNEAIERFVLPLIGPFSASGPFVFGPQWYWINILVVFVSPQWMLVPWFFQGAVSSLLPIIAFMAGRQIAGKGFGLLFALFTAISPAVIAQSTNLTYSTMVGFVCFLLFLTVVRYWYKPSDKKLFIISFLVGLSINIHFQAIGTLALIPLIILFKGLSFRKILISVLGLAVPFTPIIIFDFISDHFQTRNLVDYFFLNRGVSGLPKRWLTFGLETIPNIWAHIIGGNIFAAYFVGIGLAILGLFFSFKRKMQGIVVFFMLYLGVNIVALRYFKGGLFDAFFTYLHPVVIFLSAWMLFQLLKLHRKGGIILLIALTFTTLYKTYVEIVNSTNLKASATEKYVEELIRKYPGTKFAVYDHKYKYGHDSLTLVLYLNSEGLLKNDGHRIGVVVSTSSAIMPVVHFKPIYGNIRSLQIYDLNSSSSAELESAEWAPVNPSYIYESTVEWYKK